MHIVIYEHGLNVCNNVQPFEPLHLLLIGYLAMHYAVARMKMRHFPPGILYCVKAHFNRPVAYGVYYGGHIMAVRAEHKGVSLLLLIYGYAAGGGVVRIGLAHICRARAERAVAQ